MADTRSLLGYDHRKWSSHLGDILHSSLHLSSPLFRDVKVGSTQGSGPLKGMPCSIKATNLHRVLTCPFNEARHPSGQSALKPRQVQCHSGGWPGTFSHLHTGPCLSDKGTVLCYFISWFLTDLDCQVLDRLGSFQILPSLFTSPQVCTCLKSWARHWLCSELSDKLKTHFQML